MGYMRHHAILVTSWDADLAVLAYVKAREIFRRANGYRGDTLVTRIVTGLANAEKSFAILPDGSKEGWDLSDEMDAARGEFIDWLDAQRHEDGSTSLKWVEVQYGDDNDETVILRHS